MSPPPKYYDFPEELVMDDEIKTLGLHLRATCTERSVAHFRLHCFRLHIKQHFGEIKNKVFFKERGLLSLKGPVR